MTDSSWTFIGILVTAILSFVGGWLMYRAKRTADKDSASLAVADAALTLLEPLRREVEDTRARAKDLAQEAATLRGQMAVLRAERGVCTDITTRLYHQVIALGGEPVVSLPFTADKRILIVDDNRAHVELLSAIFIHRGWYVNTATSSGEALSRVRDCAHNVILLDWLIPKVDGDALFRAIRAVDTDAMIIVMTAYPGAVDDRVLNSRSLVLEKTLDLSEMYDSVQEVLGRESRGFT